MAGHLSSTFLLTQITRRLSSSNGRQVNPAPPGAFQQLADFPANLTTQKEVCFFCAVIEISAYDRCFSPGKNGSPYHRRSQRHRRSHGPRTLPPRGPGFHPPPQPPPPPLPP